MKMFALLPLTLAVLALGGCPPSPTNTSEDKDNKPADVAEDKPEADAVAACEGEKPAVESACTKPKVQQVGVCEKADLVQCVDGAWTCVLPAEGFEEKESLCDGLDNDCDGQTDVLKVTLDDICPEWDSNDAPKCDDCPGMAVADSACSEGESDVTIVCGKDEDDKLARMCDYSQIQEYAPFEQVTPATANEDGDVTPFGVLCDTADNDCDGEKNEQMTHLGKYSQEEFDALTKEQFKDCPQKFQGVCSLELDFDEAGKLQDITSDVALGCFGAGVKCNFDKIPGYEEKEASCDNLDNDCDGLTDEDLSVASSPCPHVGVCADPGFESTAFCSQGKWYCGWDGPLGNPDFEYTDPVACKDAPAEGACAETRCDGLDNDCDGLTDDGLVWPTFPEDCGDGVDNDNDGETDCDEDLCGKYYDDCPGATAPAKWNVECPVDADNQVALTGVCLADKDSVLMSCEPKALGAVWKCNYKDVQGYVAEEKYYKSEGKTYCDSLDNDCDGETDEDISVTDKIELTTCRYLGACKGQVKAVCNKGTGGKPTGTWSCVYNTNGGSVEVPPVDKCLDPDAGNCIWAETLCDGLDNDCDGVLDEGLDGMKLDVDVACNSISGKGVCSADLLNTRCGFPPDPKTFICDTSAIADYVADEKYVAGGKVYCDALDNDCDGQTDEDIVFASSTVVAAETPCLSEGVCKGTTVAKCNADGKSPGTWNCNYSQVPNFAPTDAYLTPEGKYIEVECDGLDNDCDGLVDENLDNVDLGSAAGAANPKKKSGCPTCGLCEAAIKWTCVDTGKGKAWQCDASAVPFYEETETSCDKIDNDCDCSVDEDLADAGPTGANCKNLGVCAQGVKAWCNAGKYECDYGQVTSYDGDKEAKCDGKDNNCDGSVDENLDWKATNACSTVGVCNDPALAAVCLGTIGWDCLYENLANWQLIESKCDGLDNDCEGKTDLAVCSTCQPCTDGGNCKLGFCNSTPDAKSYCAESATQCVSISPTTGQCTTTADGSNACSSKKQPCTCASGFWYCTLPECVGATPVCHFGKCKACVPGEKRCNGNTIQDCSPDGSKWTDTLVCPAGKICLGLGKCVTNNEIVVASGVSPISVDRQAVVAVRTGGRPVVAYQYEVIGSALSDIKVQTFTEELAKEGAEFIANADYVNKNQTSPAIAAFPRAAGGFVIVWQSDGQDGDSNGIYGRIYDNDGKKITSVFDRANDATAGSQEFPSVAAFADGSFVVAWHSSIEAGQTSKGIYARRFAADGSAIGPEFLVNATTSGDQTWPDVAIRADKGYVVSWTSEGQDANSQAVVDQILLASAVKSGPEILVNTEQNSAQNKGVSAGFGLSKGGEWVTTWVSYNQDTSANGVFMQIFDTAGIPQVSSDMKVNSIVLGSQKDPEIAMLEDNRFVIVWESENLDGKANGVAAKLFFEDGLPVVESDMQVNTTTEGDQWNPDVASTGSQGYVVVWVGGTASPPNANVYLRMFKAQ